MEWFDDEIKEAFGINVLDYPSPEEQGYQIIRSENVDLLLMKHEQLGARYKLEFKEFLEVTIPDLQYTHVTELDSSKPMYADFVKNAVSPEDYLDQMYSSDFAEHFYTKQQISGFRQKRYGKIS